MKKSKNIFVAPLDWGLGHATRCIPLIRKLLEYETRVFVGASGAAARIFMEEVPEAALIPLDGYSILYPARGSMAFAMLRQAPSILAMIRHERKLLDEIIDAHNIHAVISDNRFGLRSKRAYSVYLTHQLNIKAPPGYGFLEPVLYRLHRHYIKNFDECWIPDVPESPGLAGALSHPAKYDGYHYIGPLSRFGDREPDPIERSYALMVIISGPEPQRSIFEDLVIQQLRAVKERCILVRGKPGSGPIPSSGLDHVKIYNHLDTHEMQAAMESSKLILSRPGYSSIMDLARLGLQAAFVPTPGQTEQEYLANLHMRLEHYYATAQSDFRLNEVINKSAGYTGLAMNAGEKLLTSRIEHLLSRL